MTTPQERAELAPCPFCGGRPERIKKGLDERFAYADEVTYMCKTCGCSRSARGDTSKPGYADNSTVEQRALAAWNTRHQAAALIEADAGEEPVGFIDPISLRLVGRGLILTRDVAENTNIPHLANNATPVYLRPQQAAQPLTPNEQVKLVQAIGGFWYDGPFRDTQIADACHELVKLIAAHGITGKDQG